MVPRAALRRRLRVEALLLAAAARVGLRCFPLPVVVGALARLPRVSAPSVDTVPECVAAASAGAALAAHATCLYTAVVSFALLGRRNYDAAVHIGAARGGRFAAHAWVSVGGIPIEQFGDGDYEPLWRYNAIDRSCR
jgi:hypothetical protein